MSRGSQPTESRWAKEIEALNRAQSTQPRGTSIKEETIEGEPFGDQKGRDVPDGEDPNNGNNPGDIEEPRQPDDRNPSMGRTRRTPSVPPSIGRGSSINSNSEEDRNRSNIRIPKAKEVQDWDGSPGKLSQFIRDLVIHFHSYKDYFENNESGKIIAALNRMTGKTENWATQLVMKVYKGVDDPRIADFDTFSGYLQRTFGEQRKKDQAQEAIMRISQRPGESVLSYRLRSEELASWSGFNEESLFAHIKKGLNDKILNVLYNSATEVQSLEELWD